MIEVFYANERIKMACEGQGRTQEAIRRLIHRQFVHGDNPEKLHAKYPVYSIRVDEKSRIIYTYQDSLRNEAGHLVPIILELDENHKYNSHYLDSGVYRSFLESHTEEFHQALESEASAVPAETRVQDPNAEIVHIIGKETILLDEQQNTIRVPGILEGPPGSGKTCVAYVLLEKFASDPSNTGKKVLYLTKSQALANHIKNLWKESPYYKENHEDGAYILSYDEMLAIHCPEVRFAGSAKEKVIEFLLKEKGFISKTIKEAKRVEKAESLYLEFRIISGFENLDDYLSAGENITRMPKDQRKNVIDAFRAWQKASGSTHTQEFYRLPEQAPAYQLILSDEAQDLSHLELSNLMNLAEEKRIIYCIDPKQNLKDNNSKIVFLQNKFYSDPFSYEVEPQKLEGSYRCPPKIMALAKEVNKLRLELLPTSKQDARIMVKEENTGEIIWLDPQQSKNQETIENFKHDPEAFIITDETHKKELIDRGFSRVFTTEEIKGLQANTVVLYQVFDQDIYRKIHGSLVLIEEGAKLDEETTHAYGPPLCSLFTAITRAKEKVIVFQSEHKNIAKIIAPLKQKADKKEHSNQAKTIDIDQAIKQAKEFYDHGNLEQSKALLAHEVFHKTENNTPLIEDQIKSWAKPTPPKKMTPAVKPIPSGETTEISVSNFIVKEMPSFNQFISGDFNLKHIETIVSTLNQPHQIALLKKNTHFYELFMDALTKAAVANENYDLTLSLILSLFHKIDLDETFKLRLILKRHYSYNLIIDPLIEKAKQGSQHAAHLVTISNAELFEKAANRNAQLILMQEASYYNKIAGNFRIEERKELKLDLKMKTAQSNMTKKTGKKEIIKLGTYTQKLKSKTITGKDLDDLAALCETEPFIQMFHNQGEHVKEFLSALFEGFIQCTTSHENGLINFTLNLCEKFNPFLLYSYGMQIHTLAAKKGIRINSMFMLFARAARNGIHEAKLMMLKTYEQLAPEEFPADFLSQYTFECFKYAREEGTNGLEFTTKINKKLLDWDASRTYKNAIIQLEAAIQNDDIDAIDKNRQQVLFIALQVDSMTGYCELYNAHNKLLDAKKPGYDFNYQEPTTGKTILHKLCTKREKGFDRLLQQHLLIPYIDLTLKDDRGLSAFAILAILKETKALNLMLEFAQDCLEQLINEIPPKFQASIYGFLMSDQLKQEVPEPVFTRLSELINHKSLPTESPPISYSKMRSES